MTISILEVGFKSGLVRQTATHNIIKFNAGDSQWTRLSDENYEKLKTVYHNPLCKRLSFTEGAVEYVAVIDEVEI